MSRVSTCVLLLTTLAGSAAADGPETGLVSGTVTDAGGTPLPGVAVTITGDRGEKFATTAIDGTYRFALLVPGTYVLEAALEGMGAAEKPVQVTAGQRSEVDLELRLETAESITVTSEAPLVDKFNAGAGQTLQSEVGVEVTGENRTYFGILNLMPGVTNEDENTDLSSTRPNINGSTWADATVYIDGVDTTFSRYGSTRVFLPSSAISEVSLESGGLGTEYGRTIGSASNVIVKSGTNNYHGAFNYNRTEERWNSEYDDQPALMRRQFNPEPADFLKRTSLEKETTADQYETSLGGPIKRDQTWFFVSVNDVNTNATGKTINGDFVDESGTAKSRIVKINFQPSTSHALSASWIDTPVHRNFVLAPVFDRYGVTPHDISGELYTASYNVSVSSKLFLEAKLADQTSNEHKLLGVGGLDLNEAIRIKQQDARFPANPAGGPDWPGNSFYPYLDQDGWHNGWLLDNGVGTNKFPRTQLNLAATHFAAASHELKYGFDAQEVKWESNVQRLNLYVGGGNNLFDAESVTGYIDPRLPLETARSTANNTSCNFLPVQIGFCVIQDYFHPVLQNDLGSGDTTSTNTAIYARDRFTAGDHWTINAGVRAENQLHENDVGREVMDDTTISPRVSLSYDLEGNGRQLVTGYAGRSYHQLPQNAVNEYLTDQFNGYNGYERRLYCSPAMIDLANLPGAPLGNTCRNQAPGYTQNLGFVLPGLQYDLVDRGTFASDLHAYYKDEVILGYEWQFSRSWALDAKAIWWEVDDLIGSTTQLAENPATGRLTVFFLTANHSDYPRILNAIRNAASPANQARLAQEAVLAAYEEPYRQFEALQLQLNRRFRDNWALYSNVTFGKATGSSHGDVFNNTNDTYGENLEQVLRAVDVTNCQSRQAGRTVPVDCVAALTPFLGQAVSIINRDGKAGFDRPVIFKSTGWKVFPIAHEQRFTLGGHVTWQSGSNWERSEGLGGFNPTGEPIEIGFSVPLEPEGSRHIDPHWWLNLSGAYGFPMWKRMTGELRLEVQNATDQQDQIGITNSGEARALRRAFQRPRRLRALFGVKF